MLKSSQVAKSCNIYQSRQLLLHFIYTYIYTFTFYIHISNKNLQIDISSAARTYKYTHTPIYIHITHTAQEDKTVQNNRLTHRTLKMVMLQRKIRTSFLLFCLKPMANASACACIRVYVCVYFIYECRSAVCFILS